MKTFNNTCTTCGSVMIYLHRRGSSAGTWMCPICASSKRLMEQARDDESPESPDDNRKRAA